MEHGLSFLPDSDGLSGPSAAEYYSMVLDLAKVADQGGLSHVKMTEHYMRPYGGFCPSPLSFLAAVAAVTTRIRLMTGCLLPVFHHPVQLASETAMVDALSHGRLDVGFARAYLPYEFDALGVAMDGSRERFDLTVDLVRRFWAGEHVSVESEHFDFEDVETLPRPVQSPGPPIWIAAVMSPKSFVNAGLHGFGLLITPSISPLTEVAALVATYRDSFRPQRDGDVPRVLASLPLFVGRDDAHATAVGDALLDRYLEVWAQSTDSWSTRGSADYRGYTGMSYAVRSMTPQKMRAVGGAIVGGPQAVARRIGEVAGLLDVDGFLWQVDFGGVGADVARASVERLIESVLPEL
jgi:alkanesulfonate monooxygenase SsuD/methylene tetrahydromethanopterin reductase-like flavin-dependent oxidoreductase (luciferase family)